jgi:plastocyanin
MITPAVIKQLTMPIDVAFAPDGTPYVLQYASNFSPQHRRYVPSGGAVLRVTHDGTTIPVVTGLMFPDAMIFGPDGALYVSNYGNESSHGEGQILRIVLGLRPAQAPSVPPPSDHGPYDAGNASPPASSRTSAPTAARVAIVEPVQVTQWGFAPTIVTVHVGDSILFTNTGRIAHTVTSTTGAFDTGLIQPGRSAVITFDKPGRYPYYCQPHPWMRATIVVEGTMRAPVGSTARTAVTMYGPPPTVSLGRALGVVGLIIVGAVAAAHAMRRRPRVTPP